MVSDLVADMHGFIAKSGIKIKIKIDVKAEQNRRVTFYMKRAYSTSLI